jgi:hypothetical protein
MSSASLDTIQRIYDKVSELHDVLVGGLNSRYDAVIDRLDSIENDLYSGAGAALIISSAAIAAELQSTNFATGSAGWQILKTGAIECQEATIRGTLYAEAGAFEGGVTVDSGGSISSGQTAYNTGTGFWLENSGGTPRFSIGVSGGAGMTWDGSALTISGAITATSGSITGTLYVGAAADRIVIDGSAKTIFSESFVADSAGWRIQYDGTAEFENVYVRGEIRTAVLTYNEMIATAGTHVVVPSAGTLKNAVTTVASPTTFNVDINDPPSGHTQLFNSGDILRIKWAGADSWVTISSVSDQTTFYRYVCTLSNGSETTYNPATAVIGYGQSGAGGVLSTADATNAPYTSVFTHAGSPWSTTTEKVRIGNLNGFGSYSSDIYGVAMGDPSNQWIAIEDTNGLRMMDSTTVKIQIDNSGNMDLSGTMTIGTSGGIYQGSGTFASPTTGLKIWNDGGVGRIAGYNSSTIQWYAATDGKFYTGAGDVTLDTSGITLAGGTDTKNRLDWYDSADLCGLIVGSKSGVTDDLLMQIQTGVPTANAKSIVQLQAVVESGGTADASVRFTSDEVGGSIIEWLINTVKMNLTTSGLNLASGTRINEFSTDETMGGNSDTAVPTEQSVQEYAVGWKGHHFNGSSLSTTTTGAWQYTNTLVTVTINHGEVWAQWHVPVYFTTAGGGMNVNSGMYDVSNTTMYNGSQCHINSAINAALTSVGNRRVTGQSAASHQYKLYIYCHTAGTYKTNDIVWRESALAVTEIA